MPSIRVAAGLLLAAGLCSAAGAQTIWRCADNSYSQEPCAQGRAVTNAPPPPDAAERARASAASQRDARLADAMEKDRLRRETQQRAATQAPTLYVPPEPERPEPHKWPEKAGTRKLDVFTATVPGSRPARKHKADRKEAADKPPGQDHKAPAASRPEPVPQPIGKRS